MNGFLPETIYMLNIKSFNEEHFGTFTSIYLSHYGATKAQAVLLSEYTLPRASNARTH